MAWPCGLASTTDTWGAFRVACPHGVDSLTLVSEGHHTATVKLEGRAHVDVWLEPLGFSLSSSDSVGRAACGARRPNPRRA